MFFTSHFGFPWPEDPSSVVFSVADAKFPNPDHAFTVMGFPCPRGEFSQVSGPIIVHNAVVKTYKAYRQDDAPSWADLPSPWAFHPDSWEETAAAFDPSWHLSIVEKLYVLRRAGPANEVDGLVVIKSAAIAAHFLRHQGLRTLRKLLDFLLHVGADYRFLARMDEGQNPGALQWTHSSLRPPVGRLEAPSVFTGADYLQYKARIRVFLINHPRIARLCVICGGILRLIALKVLGKDLPTFESDLRPTYESVNSGPTAYAHLTDANFSLELSGNKFVEDVLFPDEIDYIIGRFDRGQSKVSWFPHPDDCRGTFLDYGFEAPKGMSWFDGREGACKAGSASPRSGWRQELKNLEKRVPRFVSVVEAMAGECLSWYERQNVN